MSKRLELVVLLLFFALGSCHRKLVPIQTQTPPPSRPINSVVHATNINFRYLSAKARAQVDIPTLKQTVNLNVRMRKDSVIWLSVSVAGFEGVRAYITRDSVQVLNKLQREYYAGNFAYLKRQFNVDVTFEQLQALLLGNYLPAPTGTTPAVVVEDPVQRVEYAQAGLLVQQLVGMAQGRVQQLTVRDQQTQNKYTVDYSDFRPLEATDQLFAYAALVQVQQNNAVSTVSINYRNVDVDKERLSFPFSVPSGYARKN